MKTWLSSLLLVSGGLFACGGTKPAEQPPGASVPASPASAWTTTGGPATPGVPATGRTVDAPDAGSDATP